MPSRVEISIDARDNASATLDAVRSKPLIFDSGRTPGAPNRPMPGPLGA
jgi:hypothetical protein